jgi:hypothetical protein
MTNQTLVLYIGIAILLIVVYYFYPFFAGLWISYASRKKGRKGGRVLRRKISDYFQNDIKPYEEQRILPPKEIIDDINKKKSEAITNQINRLEAKYIPRINELQTEINRLSERQNEIRAKDKKETLPKKFSDKGKNVLEGEALNSSYWQVTFLIYSVFLLLVIDTVVSSEWISQIGMFRKSELLFSKEIIAGYPILTHINFSYNALLSFMLNLSLLIITHLIFDKITTPDFLKSSKVKIIGGVLIIAVTIALRFAIPDSNKLMKSIMFTFIWLLLFISAYLLLERALRQNQKNASALSNMFFFLIIPTSLIAYLTGGLFGVIGDILTELVLAGYELRKARKSQAKKNIEDEKQNLEDGFFEGVTDEVRE